MATKTLAGIAGAVKTETVTVELRPQDIIVDEALRARHFAPTDAEVTARAISLYRDGQLEPITVRPVDGKKAHVVFGVTRVLAGRKLVEGFTAKAVDDKGTEREIHFQKEDFTLRAEVRQMTEEEAYVAAIKENTERTEISPVDAAFAHQRLRDSYGYKDAEIARQLNVTKSEVSRLKTLLQLDDMILRQVHDGALALYSALELAKLPAESRVPVLSATGGNREKIMEAVRAVTDTPPEGAGSGTGENTGTLPAAAPADDTQIDAPATGAGSGSGSGDGSGTATHQRTVKQLLGLLSAVTQHADMNTAIVTVASAFASYGAGLRGWNEKKVMDTLLKLSGK